MKKTWVAVGVFGACVGGAAWSWAEGLAGLDAQLNATGRIATLTPLGTGIAPPDAGSVASTRDPVPAMARLNDDATERAGRPVNGGDGEVKLTEGAVTACRVEVARRRRVPPAKVAADAVVVRFTIERSGRVRDAEAVSAAGTDLEVAACAKRVLSDWVFAKRATGPTSIEKTYRFAPSP